MNPLVMKPAATAGSNPSQDTPTQHGFFMLGTTSVYFYHSAQFTMENHSYQMVFTVDIPQDAMEIYVADVAANPTGWVWIFVNGLGNNPPEDQLFTLPQIQIGAVSSLTGSIIRISTANTNDSVTIVPAVILTVQRLVYFRHFDYSEAYPDPLPYIIFGDASGAYLAHYLTKLEDFDNVVFAEPPAWLELEQLMAGVRLDFSTVPYQPGQLPASSPLDAATTYFVLFAGVEDPSFEVTTQAVYWYDTTIVNAPA